MDIKTVLEEQITKLQKLQEDNIKCLDTSVGDKIDHAVQIAEHICRLVDRLKNIRG